MKTKMLMITSIFLTILIFSSCGTAFKYHQPESIQSKMHRYKNKSNDFGDTPKFNIMNLNKTAFNKYKTSRRPASANSSHSEDKVNIYGNKKTYFLTLFDQYRTISKYSEQGVHKVNICPSFHSSVVEYMETKGKYYRTKAPVKINFSLTPESWNKEYLASYPELSLPLKMEGTQPTVSEIIKTKGTSEAKDTLQQAINVHTHKILKEIKYLCEHGSSDNYYKFENLITEIYQGKTFGPSVKNTSILFKTTIFSNMALINSLTYKKTGRSIASSGTYGATDNLIEQLKISWIKTYLREMNRAK